MTDELQQLSDAQIERRREQLMKLANDNPKPAPSRRRLGVAIGATAIAIAAVGAIALFPILPGGASATEQVRAAAERTQAVFSDSAKFTYRASTTDEHGDVAARNMTALAANGDLAWTIEFELGKRSQEDLGGFPTEWKGRQIGGWVFIGTERDDSGPEWEVGDDFDGVLLGGNTDDEGITGPLFDPHTFLDELSTAGTFRSAGTETQDGREVDRFEATGGLAALEKIVLGDEDEVSDVRAMAISIDRDGLLRRIELSASEEGAPTEVEIDFDYGVDISELSFPEKDNIDRGSWYMLGDTQRRFEGELAFREQHPGECLSELEDFASERLAACAEASGDTAFARSITAEIGSQPSKLRKIIDPKVRPFFLKNERCETEAGENLTTDPNGDGVESEAEIDAWLNAISEVEAACNLELHREILAIENARG